MRFCDQQAPLNASQQDKLLRFGSIIKDELEQSGQRLALIARSGTDLSRFNMRYSHAGISLKASQNAAWSVRQLYYACDEQHPKLFDQGMSGFLVGGSDVPISYVSIVFLPQTEAAELERAALDNRTALQLLNPAYSANAYPFSLRYQNCNQWVMELLATAWGHLSAAEAEGAETDTVEMNNPQVAGAKSLRADAQAWMKSQGYLPSVFNVGWRALMWLGSFIPLVHSDDHPAEDLDMNLYRVSMPASIEAFVQARVPGSKRIEFCQNGRQVVVRRGWGLIAEGCAPGEGDTIIQLD